MAYHSNITCFFSFDLGLVKEKKCRVCGSVCTVMRNVVGPTSWAGSMTGVKREHDYFHCPCVEESWHKQAEELYNEKEKTPSQTLKKIFAADLNEVLFENRHKINKGKRYE